MKNFFYPQNSKRCDPIHSLGAMQRAEDVSANTGNARHMREKPLVPHSNNSIENATPWGNAICYYSNSKTVQFDLSDYQELVIGQVKSDS